MIQKPSLVIHFFFQNVAARLTNRKKLKNFIAILFENEKIKIESLNYIFCSDQSLLQINRKHLYHDFYTDIVSFDLSKEGDPLNGEIYISVERVQDNARQLGQSFQMELHRVIFHGALHLCGYKDKTKKQRLYMKNKEDYYLKRYFQ